MKEVKKLKILKYQTFHMKMNSYLMLKVVFQINKGFGKGKIFLYFTCRARTALNGICERKKINTVICWGMWQIIKLTFSLPNKHHACDTYDFNNILIKGR
jgi:hypothetical protein